MRTLRISIDTFTKILPKLIASGVTFDTIEKEGEFFITFTGGH
jgi:hypothetical protein